ncbi:hypothetical protein B0J18DRAFT_193329 [Chaetomium sp. MPI-SDFR-AT-0129]|nr:hypothetical protein B0J18DRAFT_193329 [Chaetomium sp. MPI-SDFR-AT-0129]
MPTVLGKRKSRPVETPEAAVDAQELLRRHFEARFKPLAGAARATTKTKTTKTNSRKAHSDPDSDPDSGDLEEIDGNSSGDDGDDSDEDQSDSEWGGVSDDEETDETPVVEVVDHTSSTSNAAASMSKRELKAYLSSRPPDHSLQAAQSAPNSKKPSTDGDQQPEDSAAFLANDLALQRLISESHILSAAGANPSHWQSQHAAGAATNVRAFAAGRTARKTTDMRVQALGAKESVLSQAKMPMAMRKGITGAAVAKESKRRREARENGIILEREAKKPKTAAAQKKGKGNRPVDAPAVGRMRGAELRVSAREARAIAASVRGPAGKTRKRRR